MAVNRALEVPRAVAAVRAFLQNELASRIGHVEQEPPFVGFQNAPLHLAQLNLQDFLELFGAQRMKHHELVETVHELR